jgi:hypothetical protein
MAITESDCLSDVARDVIGESFEGAVRKLRRLAWSYYRPRCDDPHDATEWLVSEVAFYVTRAVSEGRMSPPVSPWQWLGAAKSIRHRYWQSKQIVIDGAPVRLLGDDDDSTTITVMTAHRLQLDDDHFLEVLAGYAALGLGLVDCDAPEWAWETIAAWVYLSEYSYSERASHFGCSMSAWKAREVRTRAAIRRGIIHGIAAQ